MQNQKQRQVQLANFRSLKRKNTTFGTSLNYSPFNVSVLLLCTQNIWATLCIKAILQTKHGTQAVLVERLLTCSARVLLFRFFTTRI